MNKLCPKCNGKYCVCDGTASLDAVKWSNVSDVALKIGAIICENAQLKAQLAESQKEVELHQRVDYWHERGKAAESERDKLKAQNQAMTEALQKIAKIAAYSENDTLLDIIKSVT